MTAALGAKDVFRLVRKGIDVRAVHAHVQKPFRFLLCGDPSLVAEMRALLLSGHEDGGTARRCGLLRDDSAGRACAGRRARRSRGAVSRPARAIATGADFSTIAAYNVPILAITVDPPALASGPSSLPAQGTFGEYIVPQITREALRGRVFPHLVESARGVEIAVGRRLPAVARNGRGQTDARCRATTH